MIKINYEFVHVALLLNLMKKTLCMNISIISSQVFIPKLFLFPFLIS